MGRLRTISSGLPSRPSLDNAPPLTLSADTIADLKWAMDEVNKNKNKVNKFRKYLDGDHPRMIQNDRLRALFANMFDEFSFNLCAPVVDALTDRLIVNGFQSPQAAEEKEQQITTARLTRMQAQLNQVRQAQAPPPLEAEPAPRVPANSANSEATTPQEGEPAQDPAAPQNIEDILKSFGGGVGAEQGPEDQHGDLAEEIWKRNRMGTRSGQLHREAIAVGDSYLIVWKNEDDKTTLYPQLGHECAVEHNADKPGDRKKAAKVWQDEFSLSANEKKAKGVRITLYYPDRVERYGAYKSESGSWPNPKDFKPYNGDGQGWMQPNPWGVVPVFHFANDPDLTEKGRSELKNAIPVQNFVNKTLFDLLVLNEFVGYPQRYAMNLEAVKDPETDKVINPFKAGPENMWMFAGPVSTPDESHPTPQVGQFQPGDPSAIVQVVALGATMMAAATKTPPSHFLLTQEGPATPVSGESQKTSDTKLQSKVENRQETFEAEWEAIMELAVRMEIGEGTGEDEVSLDISWKDTRPRNESETITNAQGKQRLGIPKRVLWHELGYDAEEIEGFEMENMAAFLQAQAAPGPGLPAGPPQQQPTGGRSLSELVDEELAS